jgi:serine/threonine protein kinase
MAPERKENPKIQTKGSDIYSLGVTFLEACTGHTTPNPENLDSVSEVLRPIIKKMIKHRADERYHSIGEILEDLSAPSPSRLIFGREIQPNEPPTLGFSTNLAGELEESFVHSTLLRKKTLRQG